MNLSESLAAICGGKKMPRTEVTKKLWVYIKAKKLNNGRIITPDEKLKKIFPAKVGLLKASEDSEHFSSRVEAPHQILNTGGLDERLQALDTQDLPRRCTKVLLLRYKFIP